MNDRPTWTRTRLLRPALRRERPLFGPCEARGCREPAARCRPWLTTRGYVTACTATHAMQVLREMDEQRPEGDPSLVRARPDDLPFAE
jgi:hypothetical protein